MMNAAFLTFLATILGALVALVGVLLTLRVTQRNFETNLKEERHKAREERAFTAKHKAFLSATESVTHFLQYYMTLADREIPKDETIPIEVSEMAVSLNRLHFYCGIDTIRQSTRMGEILSTSYARALKAKMPSMFIGEEIKAVDIRIAALESMNDRFQQEIVALLGTDSLSPLLINHRQQLATNFGSIAEFYSKKVALAKARYQAIEACRDVIAQDLKGVYEAMRAVLLMARRELAFPIDEVEYAALLTQSTDSALAQMESLIKDVRTEINKMMV